jgi:hypothetical protein
MSGSGSIRTTARAVNVYDLVSDVTRMGEWSPEATGGEWIDGHAGARVGARFVGNNFARGNSWTTTCVVTAADPGREFAFAVEKDEGTAAHWRYTFEENGNETVVTESFEWHWLPSEVGFRSQLAEQPVDVAERMIAERTVHLEAGMRTTLAKLKEAAEKR